jgi:uncharacterized protein YerC
MFKKLFGGPAPETPGTSIASLKELPEYANTKIVENLSEASELIKKYSANNIFDMIEYIKKNDELQRELGIDSKSSSPLKIIETFHALQNAQPADLDSNNFYTFIKNEQSKLLQDAKSKVLQSPLLPADSSERKKVEEIFGNIATIRSREQYYKYEYLLSQLWILTFMRHMNTTIFEFTNKTLQMVKENETKRNKYTKDMLHEILNILVTNENDISEADFKFFKDKMSEYEIKLAEESRRITEMIAEGAQSAVAASRTAGPSGLSAATSGLGAPGQQPGPGQQGQQQQGYNGAPANYGGSQQGGFIRDHSRFPQAFYDLESS